MFLLILILAGCLHETNAQFSNVGSEACSQIIKAGVYNTFQTSSVQTSYTSFQSTMCSDLSSYTYNKYKQELSSKKANSQAVKVNAAASYFGIGGSVGVDVSSSTMQENEFKQFKETQSAYKQTTCSSSSSKSDFSDAVSAISNVIDPTVSTSYTNCLKVYATGIQISQNTGVNSRSLSLDIQFVTNNLGAQAYMTGVKINGPGSCTLQGPALPKGATATFKFRLIVDAVYSIVCVLPASVRSDGGITDVYVSTTPGGTYHALLFHSVPTNQLSDIKSTVGIINRKLAELASYADTNVKQLDNKITNFNTNVQTLSNTVISIENRHDYVNIGPATYFGGRSYPGGFVSMYWGSGIKTNDYTVPFKGSVVGVSASTVIDGANSAVYDVRIYVNGNLLFATGNFAAKIGYTNSSPLPSYRTYAQGAFTFNAGDVISTYINLSVFPTSVVSMVWLTLAYTK